MPVSVKCPNCGRGIKAPESAVGKQVPCPACKVPFVVQGGAPSPAQTPGYQQAPASGHPFDFGGGGGGAAPAPAAPQVSQGQWHVSINGQQYGPISKAELDQWVNEGRVNDACMLFCEGWTNWKAFAEVYGGGGGGGGYGGYGGYAPQEPRVPIGELILNRSGNVDFGWPILRVGLRTAQIALIVIVVGIILFTMLILTAGAGPGGPFSRSDQAFLGILVIYSFGAIFSGIISLVTGWSVCLSVPVRSRSIGWVIGAMVSMVVAFAIMFFGFMTFAAMMTGGGFGGRGLDRQSAETTAKILMTFMQLAILVALVLFAWFLSSIGTYFRNRGFPLQAIIFSAFVGIYEIWVILDIFVIKPTSPGGSKACMAVTFLGSAGVYGFLAVLTTLVQVTITRALRSRSH